MIVLMLKAKKEQYAKVEVIELMHFLNAIECGGFLNIF
jgi:hypothetical protein